MRSSSNASLDAQHSGWFPSSAGSVEYVVGTTHIINGTSLLGSLMQDTPFYNRPGKLWDNQVDDDKIPQRERRYQRHPSLPIVDDL